MDIYQIKKQFNDEKILICFNGPFSHSILEEIGAAVRNHLNNENVARAAISDVFAVYIELTQNARNYILHHNLPSGEMSSTIVVVAKEGDSYSVTSGNYVLKDDRAKLVQQIEEVNNLNPDELKQLYKKQLRQERPDDAVGAGIGLIDVARKSNRPIQFNFRQINDDYEFFSLTASV